MTIYFHLDLDAFFASVEELRHPEYANLPLIVGENYENSVCCSANYIARSYGVSAGMPAFMYKKLLPKNYVVISTHHNLYEQVSDQIFNYIRVHYSKSIDIYSIDECWFNKKFEDEGAFDKAYEYAKRIQDEILKKFKLSISIGISYSMFLSKMASGLKKPMGIMVIANKNDVKKYIWPLKIQKMFMVGKHLKEKLNNIRIFTIAELACFKDENKLKEILNKNYVEYIQNANGECVQYELKKQKPKTISCKRTFGTANKDDVILEQEMIEICDELVYNLQRNHAYAVNIEIYLEFNDHKTNKKIYKFNEYTDDFKKIHNVAQNLFEQVNDDTKIIRSLCYKFNKLYYKKTDLQLSFADKELKNKTKKDDLMWQNKVINLINNTKKDSASLPYESLNKNKKAFNH